MTKIAEMHVEMFYWFWLMPMEEGLTIKWAEAYSYWISIL